MTSACVSGLNWEIIYRFQCRHLLLMKIYKIIQYKKNCLGDGKIKEKDSFHPTPSLPSAYESYLSTVLFILFHQKLNFRETPSCLH